MNGKTSLGILLLAAGVVLLVAAVLGRVGKLGQALQHGTAR